jgi:hypothetical protein
MKTKPNPSALSLFALSLWLAANASLSSAFAQGTAFTYQGLLFDGTNQPTGNYDMQFYVYNAATGGGVVGGPIASAPIGVTNGLFTVVLDFGPGVFTGASSWLQIGVRTNGSVAAYVVLSPRQQLTPTPYAIFAEGAAAAGLTGTIPSGDLTGIYGGALTLNNAGNSFSGNGAGLTGLNASQLTTGTVPPARLPADVAYTDVSQTFTGINSFANNIFLLDPTKTIVFPATSGANSPMMAMFSSGTVNTDRMVIAHSLGFPTWGLQYQDSSDQFNFLSSGTPVFSVRLGYPNSVRINSDPLFLYSGTDTNNFLGQGNLGLPGNFSGTGPGLFGFEGGVLGAISPNTVCLSWDYSGDVWVSNILSAAEVVLRSSPGTYTGPAITASGNNVSVNSGFLVVNGLTPVYCYIGDDGAGSDVQIGSQKSGITALAAYNTADGAYMHFYCSSITIVGGADLAEPFKITGANEEVPEGAVVVIDEENPGHLKMSNQSYDTHVAGVVSGANGINPGIQMQQHGLLEGGKNVALTGRVYVRADTSNGVIKPGDLLTSSSNPGYAMKVIDHARAAGAILGKAMTGLKEDKGMVLVLVTLQ